MVLPTDELWVISQSNNVCIFFRAVSDFQFGIQHITEKWRLFQLNLFCSFLLEHYVELCCLTKLSCAECCARITVFHKLNGSESVTVRRYLMLVVWWWLNTRACLQRMVLTLAGRICSDCFTSLMVLFFPFPFIFLLLKAVDPWRLVIIVSDMMYRVVRRCFIYECDRHVQRFSDVYPYRRLQICSQLCHSGTIILTTVLNLAYRRSAVHSIFGSRSRLIKRLLQFFNYFLSSTRDTRRKQTCDNLKQESNLRN